MTTPSSNYPKQAGTERLKPWLFMIAGFSGLLFVMLMMGILLWQYHLNRPVDLTHATMQLTDRIEQGLAQAVAGEDEARLERGASENRYDGRHYWVSCPFELTLPPEVTKPELEQRIRESMAGQAVQLDKVRHADPNTEQWRLYYQELDFAEVLLRVAAPTEPVQEDLRVQSTRLAEELQTLLKQSGIDEAHIQQVAFNEKENATALWTVTRFETVLLGNVNINRLWRQSMRLASSHDARMELQELRPGVWRLQIMLQDHVVLELTGYQRRDVVVAEEPEPVEEAPTESTVLAENDEHPADTPQEETAYKDVPPQEKLPLESDTIDPELDVDAPTSPAMDDPVSKPGEKPQIAIVLDDGGYGGDHNEKILALDNRLTLAILPNTPLGQMMAEQGAGLGFEIMLHMPMQNNGKHNTFPGEITVDMPEEEIHALTLDALAQVPHAIGVNNHTGSTFTADPAAMTLFFNALKAPVGESTKMYFLDSRTTNGSCAYEVARDMEIPTASRDIFLDNVNEPDEIRKQFWALMKLAKSRGNAIGIGHFRPRTVEVLEEMLPVLEEKGIELVPLSELMH